MKLKMTVTLERIYEPMTEFYVDATAENILKTDIKLYQEDPCYLLEFLNTTISVKGEIIEP